VTFVRTGSLASYRRERIGIISAVRSAIGSGDLSAAEHLACGYRDANGVTPEALEAFSWVARGALTMHRIAEAAKLARQTRLVSIRLLGRTKLDAEPHLAAALGTSIEVLAQAMAMQGRRAQAVRFLNSELAGFNASPIHTRIRKNLNLLTLEGKPAPDLEIREWLGRKPPALETLRGSAVLLFFWAHYCEDSRAQGRVLVRIRDSFDRRGLQLIGPTRRYGYLDEYGKRPASSRREVQHIKQTLSEFYSDLAGMFIPLSDVNFDVYGVSTTPTLVLIDRGGIVRCYHPGRIFGRDLTARLRDLLKS